MCVSWTGYLFPWLPAESSWVGLHEPVRIKTLEHVLEHGVMFKALYWCFRSSLEQCPKTKRIFLNRVSYFPDYSLKQGQGFTVPAAHPHSRTYSSSPLLPFHTILADFMCLYWDAWNDFVVMLGPVLNRVRQYYNWHFPLDRVVKFTSLCLEQGQGLVESAGPPSLPKFLWSISSPSPPGCVPCQLSLLLLLQEM